jgi:hypothetical protein
MTTDTETTTTIPRAPLPSARLSIAGRRPRTVPDHLRGLVPTSVQAQRWLAESLAALSAECQELADKIERCASLAEALYRESVEDWEATNGK